MPAKKGVGGGRATAERIGKSARDKDQRDKAKLTAKNKAKKAAAKKTANKKAAARKAAGEKKSFSLFDAITTGASLINPLLGGALKAGEFVIDVLSGETRSATTADAKSRRFQAADSDDRISTSGTATINQQLGLSSQIAGSKGSKDKADKPESDKAKLLRFQIEFQEEQLEAIREQRTQQREAFDFLTDELNRLNATAAELDPVFAEIQQLELDRIKRGGGATPRELELIEEAVASASAQGAEEIAGFQERSLEQIRDVLAPSRGLRPTDRPIVARGEEIVEEGQRQFGQLQRGLAETSAKAKLDFPLARSRLESEIGTFQQGLALQRQTFQQGLQQTALENRLRLAGFQTTGTLGLLNTQPTGLGALQTLTSLQAAKLGQPVPVASSGGTTGGFLSGLGSLASGLGSLFGGSE